MEAETLWIMGASLGNQCLLYEACPGQWGTINIDGYSAEESMYTFLTPSIWAWRAVVGAAMDVVATGSRPLTVMASIGASTRGFLWEATMGVLAATRFIGASQGKHDSNRSNRGGEWIDVAVVGDHPGRPVPRVPSREHEGPFLVVQAGYAGYGIVESRVQGRMPWEVPVWLVKRKPPIAAWRAIRSCGVAASADNSDGYLYTLQAIARLGRLRVRLSRPPLIDPRLGPLGWEALASWEDYNLFLLVPEGEEGCLLRVLGESGVPAGIVGYAWRSSEPGVEAPGARDMRGFERWS